MHMATKEGQVLNRPSSQHYHTPYFLPHIYFATTPLLPFTLRGSPPFLKPSVSAPLGQDLNVTYGLRQGQVLQPVFVQHLRATHMAEQYEILVSSVCTCGWKPLCFLCLLFDWKKSKLCCCFFTTWLSCLTSLLRTLLAYLDPLERLFTQMYEIW